MATTQAFFVLLFVASLTSFMQIGGASSNCTLFNFGDSNSDTGSYVFQQGLFLPQGYGRTYKFELPISTRQSDGRMYIDFLCESLRIPYLSAYLQPLGTDFGHGANFAYYGATASSTISPNPIPLPTQVKQFAMFRKANQLLRSQGKGPLITAEELENAIYSIDIGQNDVWNCFNGTNNYSVIVNDLIPKSVDSIRSSVQRLYDEFGGRKYVLYNTGPLGCLPSMAGYQDKYGMEVDEIGCRSIFNNASKAFNERFEALCDALKSQLNDAKIVCIDMYSIKLDLFANPTKYGKYPTVDGTHFTEGMNFVISSKILSSVSLRDMCTR